MTEDLRGVYTIPAGVPFARTLAATLWEHARGEPERLSRLRVLLPTRRACRTVRDAFLRLTNGAPLLLPRLSPLGEVDEDEIMLAFGGPGATASLWDLPPAIDPLQRRILLARAIMARPDYRQGPDQALRLAEALAQLLDRIHAENLDMAALPSLVTGDFAAHWNITLEFLGILSATWPEILRQMGVIDAADRRNRLLDRLSALWEETPPAGPVIAAGSTGTLPAVARLLGVIARLPQGTVVLPGLDQELDQESWEALADSHPQGGLKTLLPALGIDRAAVRLWPGAPAQVTRPRASLSTALMRPAATTHLWAQEAHGQSNDGWGDALATLTRCEAESPQDEARVIAVLMREVLETPGRTAALVTPDRRLARRVAMACRRWNIEIDDSAGIPLPDTVRGGFLRLIAQACLDQVSPASLLALLRHSLCRAGHEGRDWQKRVGALELRLLRGPRPAAGFEGLRSRLKEKNIEDQLVSTFLDELEFITEPFMVLTRTQGIHPFSVWLDAHIKVAEALAPIPLKNGNSILWAEDDGEAAALFLSALREQASYFPPVSGSDYLSILKQLMLGVTVRPAYGSHPRLSVLGLMEARLSEADLVILGGLNEGTWPPDAGYDPWMSRPMRAAFGLPAPERAIGMAAHDFVQGFCGPTVVLTRARRVDGTPTVPARWLQRLDVVLQAAGIDPASTLAVGTAWLKRARMLDRNAVQSPFTRPAPRPPVNLRPRHLSATKIETWLADPYGIYARYILGLRKLEPLEKIPDAADRGNVLHEALELFMRDCPQGPLPADAGDRLVAAGRAVLDRRSDEAGAWDFWWPRFTQIAHWFAAHEDEWRQKAAPLITEATGRMTWQGPQGPFTLTARADRIDRLRDGGYALIDYKSGGQYGKNALRSAALPQLPLEALILRQGGFESLPQGADIGYLGYWVLKGGNNSDIVSIEDNIQQTLDLAEAGLMTLIRLYDDESTPYYSLPDPDRAPRFNDYEQLARVQEWTALGENEGEAA